MPGFYKIQPTDVCVHVCPKGYYPDKINRVCLLCDDSCMTCKAPAGGATKAESCTSCKPKKNADGSYT